MKTLILPPRYTPDSIALYGAAVEAGWEVERLQSWRPPSHLRDKEVALYGESLFGAVVAQELALALLEPSFRWLVDLPQRYLLRDVSFTTLGDARRYTRAAFMKPADDKCFPARVYGSGSELEASELLPENTPVLISEPVSWEVEFRFFVVEGRVATSSAYSRWGELTRSEDGVWGAREDEARMAQDVCRRLIEELGESVPPSVVIDIGKISGRGWAVVEANPSWASGIYGCDPGQVLGAVARACVKREVISGEDRRWMIERSG